MLFIIDKIKFNCFPLFKNEATTKFKVECIAHNIHLLGSAALDPEYFCLLFYLILTTIS